MAFANGNSAPRLNDESDVEEDALVNDYKYVVPSREHPKQNKCRIADPDLREQVNYDDGLSELDHGGSGGVGPSDIQAQLAAAATPLEYQASLETKFSSYDNYCSLFHYILNSDGPVDLEVPNVRKGIRTQVTLQYGTCD